jgi:putative transposase
VAGGWEPAALDTEFLDELLPFETRPIHRGEVTLHRHHYFCKELEEYHGDSVRVAYDHSNPTAVWIRDLSGVFLGEAKLDGNVTDFFSASRLGQDLVKRDRAQLGRLERKAVAKRDLLGLAAAGLVDPGAAVIGRRLGMSVVEQEPPKDYQPEPTQESLDAFERDWERAEARRNAEDPIDRLNRVEAEIAAGRELCAEDAAWYAHYQTTDSYAILQKLKTQTA